MVLFWGLRLGEYCLLVGRRVELLGTPVKVEVEGNK